MTPAIGDRCEVAVVPLGKPRDGRWEPGTIIAPYSYPGKPAGTCWVVRLDRDPASELATFPRDRRPLREVQS